ncbi:MAG: carboxypeptidase-like regulatory domain-containing protein, partial [Candidatus Latescibacteria bacterium]|nr:carboxypeptidase-like regulatory domain-containing protein [Candidatus Latescibacterota bacterium]
MKRMCLLFIISLCLVSQAFAGTTGKVSGVIKDAKSGEVLPGANVVVLGTRLGATTDADGNYFILNVPPGMLEVQASMVGYTKVTQTDVRVKIDQTTKLNFELSEQTLEAAEILVMAERPPVELDLTGSKQT